MHRKKTVPATPATASEPVPKETVTLTAEVSVGVYEQILVSVKSCGYSSVDEWLMEAIMDKV